MTAGPVILIDTREQDPWLFPAHRPKLRRATLKAGDYSVHGCSGEISIERKSLQDLFGTMTSGRDRFERELVRLSGYKFKALVVEAGLSRVRLGSRYTGINPSRMLDTVFAWCMLYGIHPVFAESRADAEDHAYRLLNAFWQTRTRAIGLRKGLRGQ